MAAARKKTGAAPTPRAQISQETFDEVVQENMEDFDMDLAEATRDAVQQFESQGVDLSNIIKIGALGVANVSDATSATTATGAGAQSASVIDQIKHAISELNTQCERLTSSSDVPTTASDTDAALERTLAQLQDLCDRIPEAKVVAGRNNAVDTLLALIDAVVAVHNATAHARVLEQASALLASLCTDSTDNQDFVGQAGMELLARVLQSLHSSSSRTGGAAAATVSLAPIARVLQVVRATCAKHEANKSHFAKAQGVDTVSALLPLVLHGDGLSDESDVLCRPLALVLRALTVNDDPNAPFSQAHETIKTLVTRDVIAVALDVVTHRSDTPEVLALWLAVLKQLAVTEESCKKIHELQGLELLQRVMVVHERNLLVMTRCITVLRNVAAADELKDVLVRSGSVERVLAGMQLHERDAALQQHACATLAAVALRAPANAERIVELGGARHIAWAMRAHASNTALLRQASLALRNIVARSAQLRPRVLDEDVEPLLRAALPLRGCGDEAYAALRDLGCEIELAAFGLTASKARFNPVQLASNELLSSVEDAAEAPFAL